MRRFLQIALVLLLCTPALRAQDFTTDYGSWTSANIKSSISSTVSLEGRVEWRTQDVFSSTNQLFARGCLAWKPQQWLRLDCRLDYGHYPSSSDKMRVIPGATFSASAGAHALYLRQWWMHSWDPKGESGSTDTFRTKVGVSRKLGSTALTPHLDYEIFYWEGIVSQERFYAGTRIKLPKGNSLDLFYLYQLLPVKAGGTHIAGLSWTLSL